MYLDLLFKIRQSANRRQQGRAVDGYVELVFDHNLYHDRNRDFVLVDRRTDHSFLCATRRCRSSEHAGSGHVRAVDDVSALVVYAVCDLLRGFVDVRVCLLQHEAAVFAWFDRGAAYWRIGRPAKEGT